MRTIQITDQISARDRVFLPYKMALLPKSWLSSTAGVNVMLFPQPFKPEPHMEFHSSFRLYSSCDAAVRVQQVCDDA